jgi:hypothetical protein
MSKFGNLLGGKNPNPTPVQPVAPAPEPVVEEVLFTPEEEVLTEASPLEEMSKKELEDYGRTLGIELDRRHSKESLIEEIKDAED